MGKIDHDISQPKIYFSPPKFKKNVSTTDLYESSIRELFIIEYPEYKGTINFSERDFYEYKKNKKFKKIWIFFPDIQHLIITVSEENYFLIRTARNRNIITHEEQKKYRACTVGIIGLSIGSIILSSLVATGGPKRIKIADDDVIDISNLNRMWASLVDVGRAKIDIAAKNTWRLDPFAEISKYRVKISEATIKEFLCENPPIDVFIDAMDSLPLKIYARTICREKGIPVIMATSNGDGVILDVERFDLDKGAPIFHGRLGKVKSEDFAYFTYNEWVEKAIAIVDPNLLTKRVSESILELNKSISGIPQLSTTVQIGAAATSFVVRKIANDQNLPSGRYIFGLESLNEHIT